MRRLAVVLAGLMALAAAGSARADVDLFGRETISGLVDVRAAVANGERSWVDDGSGKLRYGGNGTGDLRAHGGVAEADLIWRPRLGWNWTGNVGLIAQQGQWRGVDVNELYLAYKPLPHGDTRISARIGYYWPEISLEHEGFAWSVADSITPSAINSWIGEEGKVVGAEAKLAHSFGDQQVSATVGAFGYGDTSGTLLSFRGWALHDVKATLTGRFPLPRLSPFMVVRQDQYTESTRELDHRVGYYGRAEWKPNGAVSLNAFYYDNRGDRVSLDRLQWAWETRFWNLGADLAVDEDTRIRAQAVKGETFMGFPSATGLWVNMGFSSAYVMATRQFGPDAGSLRVEQFRTDDRSTKVVDNSFEHGWALTAAWKHPLTAHAKLFVEGVHVESDRPYRLYAGTPERQSQTQLQTAVRFSF